MKSAAIAVLVVTGLAATSAYAASTTVTSSDNCKTVHLKPGENPPPGSMSTSITAGNGKVSGQTTTGNGVSVQSPFSGSQLYHWSGVLYVSWCDVPASTST